MQFKTEVDISLYDYEVEQPSGEKKKVNMITGKAMISWGVEIETRGWGIKGMYSYVPDQAIFAHVEVDNEDGHAEPIVLELNLKNVDCSVKSDEYGALCPNSISYFKNKWEAE